MRNSSLPFFGAASNGVNMALDHTAMADFIIAEMRNGGSSQSIMALMGHAMAKYLCDNTEVEFSWNGRSGTSTDPVTSYITTDVQGDFSFVHTRTNNPHRACAHLAEQIRSECGKLTIGPASGWTLPRITLNNHTPPPIVPTRSNDQRTSMLRICNWVITMYKTYINPTPLMGTHRGFSAPSGAGAIMRRIF